MIVNVITLGCSKNQVDSEMILGVFKSSGAIVTTSLDDADVIVINTCGFIESAKKEAIDTILEMAEYKKYNCKHLIVTGCLAKRYKKEILSELKEVDLVIGNDEYDDIANILNKYFKSNNYTCLDYTNKILYSKFPSAYIKISDGCDNRCSYCAIPLIRGGFKSRKIEDILDEVKLLTKEGISEFNIISQDTTKYGLDIYGELSLTRLLREISKIEGVKWIRILYMYAFEITDELLDEIKTNEKICKYFDIPIQHLNNRLLKLMNRHDSKSVIFERVKKVRDLIPDAILRTTAIVGFPTETDEEFEELLEGIKELKFDKLGAFTFSSEEDTKADLLEDKIDKEVQNIRYSKLMMIQQEVSNINNKKHIGKIYEALVEGVSEDEKYFVLRTYMDAPDVDGRCLLKLDETTAKDIIIGEYAKVKIISSDEYDFYVELSQGSL